MSKAGGREIGVVGGIAVFATSGPQSRGQFRPKLCFLVRRAIVAATWGV